MHTDFIPLSYWQLAIAASLILVERRDLAAAATRAGAAAAGGLGADRRATAADRAGAAMDFCAGPAVVLRRWR